MRLFRRFLVVVSSAAALTIALVSLAMAVRLVPGSTFTGASKHRHYVITLFPECFTSGCTKATTIGVQITTGNAKHPAAECVFGTFQLPNAKLRAGKFSVSGQALAGGKLITLKASGIFTSSRQAHGTVSGPVSCGGADGFRLTQTQAG